MAAAKIATSLLLTVLEGPEVQNQFYWAEIKMSAGDLFLEHFSYR